MKALNITENFNLVVFIKNPFNLRINNKTIRFHNKDMHIVLYDYKSQSLVTDINNIAVYIFNLLTAGYKLLKLKDIQFLVLIMSFS